MIVEQVGRNDVLVRYRDANGNRQQTVIKDRLPYLYLRDEDAPVSYTHLTLPTKA